jgi:hypothetical protein
MSNELFIELNDEQQELVSGGIDFSDLTNSDFEQQLFKNKVAVVNGPQGSAAVSETAASYVDSDITKAIDLSI